MVVQTEHGVEFCAEGRKMTIREEFNSAELQLGRVRHEEGEFVHKHVDGQNGAWAALEAVRW